MTSYIDDLLINEQIVSADKVKSYLSNWGLQAKAPERLGKNCGVRVLGLKVNADWS